jgi:phenylpropionate dioxygenase-like ring-hydroxylating dioxygenase large terminal subunit
MPLSQAVGQMVAPDRGIISREIFVDRDVYQEELRKVFTRAWLFVGHESLIPNSDDFFASRMGEESVILCRDKYTARSTSS